MWLMKTLLTSGCTNQRGAGQWDLWENDFRVVIAYSKDDAELKFTEMTGFNEHYYIESIEKIVLSDIEKILLEN
ncbi:hypothetical protein QT958_22465 (plasmid) [Enterobacter hormaechei]|uniref:hypothetical protein n=1 Tax=Enterobacter hormaechei TaxID=158836 RepID=UPI00260E1FD2|nr:hypothetical protein [Enterobacter hormaechei]WKB01894.1 hypothetical protein QT958_22465 [Enterobacter hormaechei]